MLRAADVSFSRGRRLVISQVNLEIHAGQLTAVIGPNGAGKSTLLKLLAGDLKPQRGVISLDDRNLQDWQPRDLAARRAVLSQSTSVVFPFTVQDVISLAFPDDAPRALRHELMREGLRSYDLESFEHRLYQELSGGEQQRVHLARVVCQLQAGPASGHKLLFLDEPVSNLDIKHQVKTLASVRQLLSPTLGAFVILHDLNLAVTYADRIIIIHEGQIVADDTTPRALTSATLKHVFDADLKVVRKADGVRVHLNA